MFSVGDKVVYPMHGAGLIEAVEERMYEEKPTQYLVLSMFLGNMKVRIPVCNLEKVGLRPIIPPKKMKEIQKVLAPGPSAGRWSPGRSGSSRRW